MIDVHGKETLYEYYNDGRLLSVTYEGQLFSYTYDAVGRLGSLTYPTTPDTLVLNFTWDDDGRLLSMEYLKNRAAFQGFTYGYDDSGNRVTMDEVGPGSVTTNWEYGYDWFNRLTSVTKNTILQESYTYDESDNRKTMSRPLVNELWEYSYDLADQLESITVTVDAGSPTLLESFESDEDGNMLTRDKGGVVTEYRWDSQNRLTQVKVDGDVVVRSIYDAFMQGHQLLGVEQGGNLHYYLVDGLANVRLVLDSSGSIVASTVFDEFGIPEDVSGSADLRPHGYTGGLGVRNDWDSSDLHYMRHRYYDPQLGRWLSADPIGFAGGLNLYTYVGQNPINRVDPEGLDDMSRVIRDSSSYGLPNHGNPGLQNPWNPTDTQSLNNGIDVVRSVDPGKASILQGRLRRGEIRPLNPAVTGWAEGFTPGDTMALDAKVVRCGDKVRLGSLLIHEEEHIGQAGKGKAIWDYVKSGFNYAKNLETGAYSGQLNTLRQLRSQYPSGTQSRASLEAEILRTTTRLNNLNSTGHI